MLEKLNRLVSPHVQKYLEKNGGLISEESVKLCGYAIVARGEDSHDDLHYDSDLIQIEDSVYQRPFVCLLYLNEIWQGGQLIFPTIKKVVTPKAGLLVLFPASFAFPHSVLNVHSQDRYSIRLTYCFDPHSGVKRMDRFQSQG